MNPAPASEIEASILGSILENPDGELPPAISRLIENAPESFDDQRHGAVAAAMRQLRRNGEPLSTVGLNARLKFDGSALLLMELPGKALGIDAAAFHADELWRQFKVRQAKELLGDAAQAIERHPTQAGSVIQSVIGELGRLTDEAVHGGPDRIRELLAARQFNFAVVPPPAVPRFKLGETPISTPGNLTAISAAVKSGKSSFVSAMQSATMAARERDCLGVTSSNPKGLAVICFDTEQSVEDHDAMARRVLRRAGVDSPPSWFLSYCLTGFSVPDLQAALRDTMQSADASFGGIHSVFLDGVGDMVPDVNDAESSNAFVAELHALAIKHSCPIVGVIHLNPNGEKTRGHLGSQLERKAESNLRLERDGDAIVCWSEKNRKAPISKSKGPRFVWSDELGMHVSSETSDELKDDANRAGLEAVADAIFCDRPAMRYGEMLEKLTAKTGLAVSPRTASRKIVALSKAEIIKKSVAGLYSRA